QLLLRDRELSALARESATEIRVAARQLNRMILNLLDLSKADEGKLSARRGDVELAAMVGAVTRELELAAGEREVTFEVSLESGRVFADDDLLRRTVANFLENAVRLAPQGTPSSRGGRGLGLTFCRFASEAHGGSIWIEDANPGAVFALRIPDAG